MYQLVTSRLPLAAEAAIESWILVARALFIVSAILVAFNCIQIIGRSVALRRAMANEAEDKIALALNALAEEPPHNPLRNAIAWLIISLGGIVGALIFIYGSQVALAASNSVVTKMGAITVWSSLATATVWRAADRSKRPYLIWRAAAIFGTAGFLLTFGEAVW